MLLRNTCDLKVIDFDKVEQKNCLSQFYSKPSVGKNKALALAQQMQFFWGTRLGTVPHRLTKDNTDQLLSNADLVLDCLDNAEARQLVQSYARRTGTPCLHGALAADGAFGRVIWSSSFTIDEEVPGGVTCEDGAHLPFIMIVASYLAYAAQKFLRTGSQISFHIHPVGVQRL